MRLPQVPEDAAAPPLVRDAPPGDALPRGFRRAPGVSGSAQFCVAELEALRAKVPRPLTVIDLRREPHGFVEGIPISWYAGGNWGSVDRSREEALAWERQQLSALAAQPLISFTSSLKKDQGKGAWPSELAVGAVVRSERQVVEEMGARYERLLVNDHLRPDDAEVDHFLEMVRALPEDAHVHFHCRGGKGRTVTFLNLYDTLRNAPRLSLEEIVARQAALSGGYSVLALPSADDPKYLYRSERAGFVRAFYAYCADGGFLAGTSFSRWCDARSGSAS